MGPLCTSPPDAPNLSRVHPNPSFTPSMHLVLVSRVTDRWAPNSGPRVIDHSPPIRLAHARPTWAALRSSPLGLLSPRPIRPLPAPHRPWATFLARQPASLGRTRASSLGHTSRSAQLLPHAPCSAVGRPCARWPALLGRALRRPKCPNLVPLYFSFPRDLIIPFPLDRKLINLRKSISFQLLVRLTPFNSQNFSKIEIHLIARLVVINRVFF